MTNAESVPIDLATLTNPQLVELAETEGIPVRKSWRKQKLIQALLSSNGPDPLALTAPHVAVVGFAEGHAIEAPFDDPTWEIWGINRLHTLETVRDKKFHRWFNLHDLIRFHGKDEEHLEFLRTFDGPVYLRPQDIGKVPIPNAVPFPADVMVERFGRYFNNTISWLLAYALYLQPKAMGVYGVDMAQDMVLNAEYPQQRPSCEYFIGIASGLGIPVTIPKGSDLLRSTHLYGLEDADPFTEKAIARLQEVGQRKEQAKAELAKLENQREQVRDAINQLDGAMQDTQFYLRNWVPQPVESLNGKVE